MYLVAYVLQGLAAVGLGIITTHAGLSQALWVGVPVMVAFAAATLTAAVLLARPRALTA
jgi:hypothetical protein